MLSLLVGVLIVCQVLYRSRVSAQLSNYYVSVASNASPIEKLAAARLSNLTNLPMRAPSSGKQFAVGYSAAMGVAPHLNLDGLGDEGFAIVTSNGSFAISGGRDASRGTLYAIYAIMEELGWRFWTANVTDVPTSIHVPEILNIHTVPAFEYRETNNHGVTGLATQEWAAGALRLNGDAFSGSSKPGGGITYAQGAGSVHTSFNLVSPSLSKAHPEWFSEHVTQLCWANESLMEYMIQRVLDILDKEPSANIISVSQNDNTDYCKRPADQAIIDVEGSPSAPLLQAVNKIADAILPKFPHVAVDTLAYQYTRKPPNVTKPRPNVIVRLCSIECDFGHPLTDPVNAPFNADLVGWGGISNRVYIWDYVVDYANTVMPWPNYAVLGPNIAHFHNHGVKGVFEEGSYWAKGGDLEDLKTYIMAKSLWDPSINSSQVTADFIEGYYGKGAAAVKDYINIFLASEKSTRYYMGESVPVDSAYLDCTSVVTAAGKLAGAIASMPDDPKVVRLQQVALTTCYVALLRWDEIQQCAKREGHAWPWAGTKQETYNNFAHWYRILGLGDTGKGALNEGGNGLSWLCKTIAVADPTAGCKEAALII